jgi:predicted RNA-binding Zn-ribbon protein involved in translation (DUF1610 family)
MLKKLSKKIELMYKNIIDTVEKRLALNTNLRSFKCPRCNHVIRLDNNKIQNMVIQCPVCGQQNVLKLPLERSKKKHDISNLYNMFLPLDKNAVIIGSILLFLSIIPLLISSSFSFKISLTLIIISIIISLFIIEKQRNISLKITIIIIVIVILLFFVTGADLELYLIFIFLGVLITKTLLNEYLPPTLKIRMNIFILVFLTIFLIIIIKRIINLINI